MEGSFFNQMDPVARPGDVKGCLDAGDPRANDQYIRVHTDFAARKSFMKIHPVYGGGADRLGLLSCLQRVFGHPGAVFTDTGHLKVIRVQARPLAGVPESPLVKPGRTGCNHHPVDAHLPYVLLNHLLAGIGAHELVVPGNDNVSEAQGEPGDFLHGHLAGNVRSAVADIKANPGWHPQTPIQWVEFRSKILLPGCFPLLALLFPGRLHRLVEKTFPTIALSIAKFEIHYLCLHPDAFRFAGGENSRTGLFKALVRHDECKPANRLNSCLNQP